ncbi:hypothetical protein SAICODRAFT_200367 [Saitoella complicata NRRL Y-17804]|uniref:uncharacterized protein n=1 Tax=Saitoella complicata (strain BCRC 22490 / CBS 7301 / JCM 7358 / NBRC 10748 / NRRL Y-17804) TaxID=698492 RepID=UPI0008674F37|nr:uncharacterized protein SAICODRAFT_200367 [Saitoella complicata NRRL Y-17804]ODQ55163.1 hypothetical protein SAICODRAFT_200367 [Saitoella complicata NRRL Y-17804]
MPASLNLLRHSLLLALVSNFFHAKGVLRHRITCPASSSTLYHFDEVRANRKPSDRESYSGQDETGLACPVRCHSALYSCSSPIATRPTSPRLPHCPYVRVLHLILP